MRSIESLLSEYGESHQNATNKTIHWICVPTIFFSIVGLLYSVKLPLELYESAVNLAHVALLLVILYYIRLSLTLAIGMLAFALSCLWFCELIEQKANMPLWAISLILFVVAWIGQFYGHKVEGKKPSFLKDVQFLLIGPAWLMSFIYRLAGVKY